VIKRPPDIWIVYVRYQVYGIAGKEIPELKNVDTSTDYQVVGFYPHKPFIAVTIF
jgi:hypothetical protein